MKSKCSRLRTRETSRRAFHCGLGLVAVLSLAAVAAASTLAGTVMNRTTGLPSVGDDVVLCRVDQSMHVEARTKTGGRGEFRFSLPPQVRYLIAARHQGVFYHTKMFTGAGPAEVSVYDAVPKVKEMREQSDTLFLESAADSLKVTEFLVFSNPSNRTVTAENTFDFVLPRHAVLESVAVQPPNTLPTLVSASARGSDHRYGVSYPLRPGITKVRVIYHLPLSDKASFALKFLRPVATLVLMVPPSMAMATEISEKFERRGEQNGLVMYTASYVRAGVPLNVSLLGSERLKEDDKEVIALARSVLPHSQRQNSPVQSDRVPVTISNSQLKPVFWRSALSWGSLLTAALIGACIVTIATRRPNTPLIQKTQDCR